MHHHSSPQSPSPPPPQPLYKFLTTPSPTPTTPISKLPSFLNNFKNFKNIKNFKIPTFFIFTLTSLFTLLLLLSISISISPPLKPPHPSLFPPSKSPSPLPTPPSLSYLLTGSLNQTSKILRLLHSIYHPKNFYLLHLDHHAQQTERDFLAITVQENGLFRAAQNVLVVGNGDFSSLAATLRGASILLRVWKRWDWFVNLSADDYPLVTQDGTFFGFLL